MTAFCSDVDFYCVKASPTRRVLRPAGLPQAELQIKNGTGEKPDFAIDEVGRYCSLLLEGDPKAGERSQSAKELYAAFKQSQMFTFVEFVYFIITLAAGCRNYMLAVCFAVETLFLPAGANFGSNTVVAVCQEWTELQALRSGLLTGSLVSNYLNDAGGRNGLRRLQVKHDFECSFPYANALVSQELTTHVLHMFRMCYVRRVSASCSAQGH
eukprot:SAG31_NODE_13580_length_859_cov_1.686842_1_plen_212_part_00